MRAARLVISIVAAAALTPLTATVALAAPAAPAAPVAPPANDTPDGAVPISLGDTVKEDTSQATTDKTDARDNRFCGAPYTNASVWYTYAAAQDGSFVLDMSKSDYTGGFMIFQGTPTPRHMLACGPTQLGIDASAGTTYTIMVFSDTKKNGGKLVMSLKQGPPPPTLAFDVDVTGKVLPGGKAQVSGTYTCTDGSNLFIQGDLTQIWKRVKITGTFHQFLRQANCDGQAHDWTRVVKSHNGLYAAGKASLRLVGEVCGPIDCTDVKTRKQITLTKSGAASTATLGSAAAGSQSVTVLPRSYQHWPTD